MLEVRPLTVDDLAQVVSVQRTAYITALIEPRSSYAARLKAWPRGALGAFHGPELAAYLFCHPWTRGVAAPLGAGRLDIDTPAVLYIHDLAVRPEHRGKGIAEALVRKALEIGERCGLEETALVAVQTSRAFWERFGFRGVRELEYAPGAPAWYMVRPAPRRSPDPRCPEF